MKNKGNIKPNFQDFYIRSVMEIDQQNGTELLMLNRPQVYKMLEDIKKSNDTSEAKKS